ncbi:uncharacterized protein BO97DRAFT_382183 [Aspergillus homomorphus CBS 101889]|uniref:Transcription initiation factor TFIID subunit 4 n=1 Tax=Aspergillus homomorphus (strain CBS 101889) TaxID=1450537 RepID=A0A395IA02_ASPHC|nr:hypothetical protein BO97DRAFT_382183 [Aspergillus homomorphus CBS 101889]RAL16997.1 hypothetical protein BO97DRAFT_382183 [Aspergillus homomorphus CBS 101889]
MAQPPPPPQTQHYAPSFSPPGTSPSPGAPSPRLNGGIPPKPQQRLSPLPQSQSPYASPSFGTLQLPPNQSAPYNANNMNGVAPPPTPAPPPSGTMGPPSRPVEKATDAAELTDVLASSGIDVREEEAFLTSSYSGPGVQAQQPPRPQQPPLPQQLHHQPPPPPAAANTSFTSQTSTAGTIPSTPSFGDNSQYKPPTTQDSYYTEPASQPPAPFKDPNEPTREDSEAARRAQYHLQHSFLLTKVLEQKLQKRGFELGVRIPAEGLYHPVPGRQQPIEVTGPDGSSIIRSGQTILNQTGAPLLDILSLMSIACEERLRSVVDYASTLARSRRAHSHGVVPTEWKDVASAKSAMNGSAEVPSTPAKRPNPSDPQSARSLSDRCRIITEKDNASEEARAAKRAKRSASAILGDGMVSRAESVDIPGSGASTPIAEKAPSLDKKGLTKKEAKKLMDAKASEAHQHQQSVETARLATNSMLSSRMFGTKKSYSWLNRGPAASSGFSTPSRVNTATPTAGGSEKAGRSGEPAPVPAKRLGTWREDKEKGAGIQRRDLVLMLELDGRGPRHLQKAYSKDVKEDRAD